MARISPEERETIILYNDAEDTANIYTHDKIMQRHIEKELGVKPWRVQGLAKDYQIPKKWLRLPRKPSERRREAAKKSLEKRGGFNTRKNKVLDDV
jgi:hypothetical protein